MRTRLPASKFSRWEIFPGAQRMTPFLLIGLSVSDWLSLRLLLLTLQLDDDLRPAIPPDFRNPMLEQRMAQWWDKDPAIRGDFGSIVVHMEVMLKSAGEGALPAVLRRLQQRAASPKSFGMVPFSDFSPMSHGSPSSSPFSREYSFALSLDCRLKGNVDAASPSQQDLARVGRCLYPSWVSKDFSDSQLRSSSLPGGPTSDSGITMPVPVLPSSYEKGHWETQEKLDTNFSSAPFGALLSGSVIPSTSTVLQASDFDKLDLMSTEGPSTSSYVEVPTPGSESPSMAYAGNVRCDEVYRHVRHDFHSSCESLPLSVSPRG